MDRTTDLNSKDYSTKLGRSILIFLQWRLSILERLQFQYYLPMKSSGYVPARFLNQIFKVDLKPFLTLFPKLVQSFKKFHIFHLNLWNLQKITLIYPIMGFKVYLAILITPIRQSILHIVWKMALSRTWSLLLRFLLDRMSENKGRVHANFQWSILITWLPKAFK